MTTVRASVLRDRASARQVETRYITEASNKVLLTFNGYGTIATYLTINISSVVDAGVGVYTPNYAAVFEGWSIPTGSAHDASVAWNFVSVSGGSYNANTIVVLQTHIVGVTFYDSKSVTYSVCGRLA